VFVLYTYLRSCGIVLETIRPLCYVRFSLYHTSCFPWIHKLLNIKGKRVYVILFETLLHEFYTLCCSYDIKINKQSQSTTTICYISLTYVPEVLLLKHNAHILGGVHAVTEE
jgi:hypothetical protein